MQSSSSPLTHARRIHTSWGQGLTLGHDYALRVFPKDAAEIGLPLGIYSPVNSVLTFLPPDRDGALRGCTGRCAA